MRNLTYLIGQELILVVVVGECDAVLRQKRLCLVDKGNKLTELETIGKISPRDDDVLVANDLVVENGVHNAVGGELFPAGMRTADAKSGVAQHSANLGRRVTKEACKLNRAVSKIGYLLHSTLKSLLGDVSYAV